MLRNYDWYYYAACLLVLLDQRTYVVGKLSYSFTLVFHGPEAPYAPGDTYNTSCYVEASGNDSLSDLDVYLNFGSITYCHNNQAVQTGRNHSCAEATVQNRTTYYFTLPDLRVADSGTYSCKISHKTEGDKVTISQNITVRDGTGGSTPIHSQTFSALLLLLAVVACYSSE
ncbi:uncharacterized protein LOC134255630 isoform X2 [Saccostrea cucullata]|uniref:uncharacterized protein LOC134255630 isoform X2 n=1 Tax=Saccostrea cuccullata TaxID=36930 RepID=UPI002ED3FC02